MAPPGDEDDDTPATGDGREEGPGGSGRGPAGDTGAGGSGPVGGNAPDGVPDRAREPGLPALVNMTLPLATLLGMADRPGEVPGFGSVDAGLVRDLAAAAAASGRTRYCFTITDRDGRAAGHACARLIRESRSGNRATGDRNRDSGGRGRDAGTAGRAGPDPGTGWDLAPDPSRAGPDGGYGAWVLTVPGGSRFRLDVHPVPLDRCDHRYATDAYRPGRLLRHLVEVRDGECSFPGCSHPASQSDFEHSVAWQRGGVTDACNSSPMSRSCHQVKQKPGWSVTHPAEPGRHLWRTPSGRTYEKGAKNYPA